MTLDSPEAEFDMELTVSPGKGYLPAEADGRPKLPIGEIPIDAIFSPVRRVNYKVERTRVGGHTDFDRLIMDVWCDGTTRPEAALRQSARILVELFSMLAVSRWSRKRTLEEEERRHSRPHRRSTHRRP